MMTKDTNLKKLAALCPPMLCEAIGYPGSARYVACYRTPCGDEVMYEATHWLLVDRETGALYIGAPGETLRALRGQYADQAPASEARREMIFSERSRWRISAS